MLLLLEKLLMHNVLLQLLITVKFDMNRQVGFAREARSRRATRPERTFPSDLFSFLDRGDPSEILRAVQEGAPDFSGTVNLNLPHPVTDMFILEAVIRQENLWSTDHQNMGLICRNLVARGASATRRTSCGVSSISLATRRGNWIALVNMIRGGSLFNARFLPAGESPCHDLVMHPAMNTLYREVRVAMPGFWTETINDVRATGDFETPIFEWIRNHLRIDCQLFVREGANLAFQNRLGKNPLMVALELQRSYVPLMVNNFHQLRTDAVRNQVTVDGENALFSCKTEMHVDLLVHNGYSPHVISNLGRTPAFGNPAGVVVALYRHGVSLTHKDNSDHDVLSIAYERWKMNFVPDRTMRRLLDFAELDGQIHGPTNITSLHVLFQMAWFQDYDLFHRILTNMVRANIDPGLMDSDGSTPFLYLIDGHLRMVNNEVYVYIIYELMRAVLDVNRSLKIWTFRGLTF